MFFDRGYRLQKVIQVHDASAILTWQKECKQDLGSLWPCRGIISLNVKKFKRSLNMVPGAGAEKIPKKSETDSKRRLRDFPARFKLVSDLLTPGAGRFRESMLRLSSDFCTVRLNCPSERPKGSQSRTLKNQKFQNWIAQGTIYAMIPWNDFGRDQKSRGPKRGHLKGGHVKMWFCTEIRMWISLWDSHSTCQLSLLFLRQFYRESAVQTGKVPSRRYRAEKCHFGMSWFKM